MKNNDTQVFAGQLVAQNMLIQILMGKIVLSAPDRGAPLREALVQGTGAIRSDITAAKEQLGWTPSIALEDGLRATIDFFKFARAS